MNTNPVIVSFYTSDTYYHNHAIQLIADLNRLNNQSPIKFEHDIVLYEKASSESWSRVTYKKPEFIRRWLDTYDRIIWIDIDSKLHRLPVLLEDNILNCKFELGGIIRDELSIHDYLWYIKSTETTKRFFEDVTVEIDTNYRHHAAHHVREGGDHDAMLRVLKLYRMKYPEMFGAIGGTTFANHTGWATIGVSHQEPKTQPIAAHKIIKSKTVIPTVHPYNLQQKPQPVITPQHRQLHKRRRKN